MFPSVSLSVCVLSDGSEEAWAVGCGVNTGVKLLSCGRESAVNTEAGNHAAHLVHLVANDFKQSKALCFSSLTVSRPGDRSF